MRLKVNRGALVASAVIVVLALGAYVGALHYPMAFDDPELAREVFAGLGSAPDLRPRWLSSASFWWTTTIVGVDVPLLRLQNVLLHAAAAVALFLLCRELVVYARERDLIAAIAAGAFTVHPVAAYGVAYLAQRSTVMATLFSVLSLLAWLRGRTDASSRWLVASVVFYVMALLSKEHAVMLPAVAVLMSMAIRERVSGSTRQAMVVLGLMGAAALWTLWSLRSVVGVAYEPQLAIVMGAAGPAAEAAAAAPPAPAPASAPLHLASALSQAGLFFRYVLTWLLPLPALMSIDLRPPTVSTVGTLAGAIAFIAWGAYGLLQVAAPSGRRLLGLAMLTPWLLFFTEFAAVRVQEPLVLYRSYLWGIGFAIFVAGAAVPLGQRALVTVGVALAVAFSVGLRDRLATFESPLALWDDAVLKLASDRVPYADRPVLNRGVALMREGRREEALRDFDRALNINPANPVAFFNRAVLHAQAGRTEQARADLAQARRLQRGAL